MRGPKRVSSRDTGGLGGICAHSTAVWIGVFSREAAERVPRSSCRPGNTRLIVWFDFHRQRRDSPREPATLAGPLSRARALCLLPLCGQGTRGWIALQDLQGATVDLPSVERKSHAHVIEVALVEGLLAGAGPPRGTLERSHEAMDRREHMGLRRKDLGMRRRDLPSVEVEVETA